MIGSFGLAPIDIVTTTRTSWSGKKCTYLHRAHRIFDLDDFDFGMCVVPSGISQPSLTVKPGRHVAGSVTQHMLATPVLI